jgi:membrane protein
MRVRHAMKRDQPSSLMTALAFASLLIAALTARPELRAAPDENGSGKPARARRPSKGEPGHNAGTPSEIPALGWWSIAKRVAGNVSEDRLMTEAAAITFYSLLALFPALAALVSIYGLFADPTTISSSLSAGSDIMPGGGMQIITDQVHSLATNSGRALGFGVVLGLVTSLWSANQGTKALFDALNVVYHETEKRSFLLRTAATLACTLAGILFVLVAMAAVIVVPIVLNSMGLGGITDLLLRILRWPVLLVSIAALLACIYRIGPSRESARWRWVTWGGAFAAITWVVGSLAFSWYVSHFGSYNKTYGSLGAAVGFMTWIWLSATVVLVGAELNAEMEHQTARDTTTGPERAAGARGATKADEIATA